MCDPLLTCQLMNDWQVAAGGWLTGGSWLTAAQSLHSWTGAGAEFKTMATKSWRQPETELANHYTHITRPSKPKERLLNNPKEEKQNSELFQPTWFNEWVSRLLAEGGFDKIQRKYNFKSVTKFRLDSWLVVWQAVVCCFVFVVWVFLCLFVFFTVSLINVDKIQTDSTATLA